MVLQKGQPPPGWPFCVFPVDNVIPMGNGLSFREVLALSLVRMVNGASRLTGRGSGTVAGGRVGLRLAPTLLGSMSRNRVIVIVSGTNGKTTTSAMIAKGWGGDVAANQTGSNMPPGHLAALSENVGERVVLEVDEAWLPAVTAVTSPAVVVLLNLSRDQLDRANEVRQMAGRWRTALATLDDNTVVVANANDPLIVYGAELAPRVVWCDVTTPWLEDAVSCPKCTSALVHEDGAWHCECGFAKPMASTVLGAALEVGDVEVELDLQMPGVFNRSNAAMAITALNELGVDPTDSASRIGELASVAGRFSVRRWRGHSLRLLLAKNPAGFTAMLPTVASGTSDLWIAINARVADGHDPSWLYDVPFELLRGHRVYCFGDRRLDLATRLDYAGVSYVIVDDDATVPLDEATVPVLANYTAFREWLEKSSAA